MTYRKMKLFLKRTSGIIKENKILVLIIIFTLFIRLFLLNQFPIGITHDELSYVLSAKSIFWTHTFLPGTAPAVLPTATAVTDLTVAEIPALILALIIGPFELSLFLSRVVGSLLSTFAVLAVYFLTKHLTNNRKFALISAVIMAINPWSILMGRTMFEVNFYVAFFLAGFLVLISKRNWKIFYSFPFYFLGFFSYTGGQISFYLFMVGTLAYNYFLNAGQRIKPYLAYLCLATLILLTYLGVTLRNQSFASRSKEIYLPGNFEISETVNLERKTAVQSRINNVFINKATVYVRGFIDKYLNTFSANNLFIKGETRGAYSYPNHGKFYFLDIFFIITGFSFLFSLNKKGWWLVIFVLIVGPITAGLSVVEFSYSQRAGLIFPFLAVLIGIGIGDLINLFQKKIARSLSAFLVAAVYAVLFINLLHIYFYRYQIQAADDLFFQDRVLSNYIKLTAREYPNYKIIVSSPEPKIIFEEYLFFSNLYSGEKIKFINQRIDRKDYSYGKVVFQDSCPKDKIDKNTVWIYNGGLNCEKTRDPDTVRITRLKDVLETYLIRQDQICKSQNLNSYVPLSAYGNFKIEKQSVKEFCNDWITKLN